MYYSLALRVVGVRAALAYASMSVVRYFVLGARLGTLGLVGSGTVGARIIVRPVPVSPNQCLRSGSGYAVGSGAGVAVNGPRWVKVSPNLGGVGQRILYGPISAVHLLSCGSFVPEKDRKVGLGGDGVTKD